MIKYLVFPTFLMLLFAHGAFAHLEGEGRVFDQHKIEFSTLPEELRAGESANLFISLEQADTGERISGVPAWVRISNGNEITFSSTNLQTDQSGVISILYSFSSPGTKELFIRFSLDDKTVETEYNIEVLPGDKSSKIKEKEEYKGHFVVKKILFAAAIVIIIFIIFIKRKK